jgi:heme A synthase
MSALRTVFRYWLWILLALVVLQIAFAGYGAFDTADKATEGALDEDAFDDSWGLHVGFGYLVLLGSLLTPLVALAARAGRPVVMHSLAILGLVILQVLLAWFGEGVPAIFGALHPINAFVIVGAIASLAAREWRSTRMMRREPVAPPSAAA